MGRALAAQGHTVRLMSPEYVRPYVKAQKNDNRDAEAIAEAATRPTMRFVELKSEEQLDMQTLHRVRDQLVGERTSLMNQIRSLLLERGRIVPQGRAKLAACLAELLDGQARALSARIHARFSWTCEIAGWRSISGSLTSIRNSPHMPTVMHMPAGFSQSLASGL
jgi:transposase